MPIVVVVFVGLAIVVGGGGFLLKEKTDEQKQPESDRSFSQSFKDLLKGDKESPLPSQAVNSPSPIPKSPSPKASVSTKVVVATPKPSATLVPTPTPSPSISSVSPSSAKYSDSITIRGNLLGSSTGQVVIESPTSGGCCGGSIEYWSDTEVRAKVPALAKGNNYKLKVVTSSGKTTNQLSFTITAGQPYVSSISPYGVKPYSGAITISGSELGNSEGYISFTYSGSTQTVGSCMIESWSDNQIVCGNLSVPYPNYEYMIFVRTSENLYSSGKFYYVGG